MSCAARLLFELLAELLRELADSLLKCFAISLLILLELVLRKAAAEFDVDLGGVGHFSGGKESACREVL